MLDRSWWVFLAVMLTACGGGGSGMSSDIINDTGGTGGDETPAELEVGGRLVGLEESVSITGSGFTATLATEHSDGGVFVEAEQLRLTENGEFRFEGRLEEGSRYRIRIGQVPEDLLCSIEGSEDWDRTSVLTVAGSGNTETRINCRRWPFTVSGSLRAPRYSTQDTDTNDPRADYIDNSGFAIAQPVYSTTETVPIHGYVTAQPTGNLAAGDRFATSSDVDDYFRTDLAAEQRLTLTIAEHADGADLDLYLYQVDPLTGTPLLADESMGEGPEEQLNVPADGEYFIQVQAFAGSSAYTLLISDAPEAGNMTTSGSVDFVPGDVIIRTDRGGSLSRMMQGAGIRPLAVPAGSGHDRATLLKVDVTGLPIAGLGAESSAKLATLRAIKALRQQPGVRLAAPNFRVYPHAEPNDPEYDLQWHYPRIRLPEAWDVTTGSTTGGNVVVAVVDTGVLLTHPELEDRLLPGYDFIRDPEAARDGDGIDPDPDDPGNDPEPGSSNWHGTHVAGTIGAESDNGIGVAGVSWHVDIMPLRALGVGGGTVYDILQSVRYAAGLSNDSGGVPARVADIINLSLGGPGFFAEADELFEQLRDMGIMVVASAGNNASTEPMFPAAYDSVLAVSGTDSDDLLAGYSNFGAFIDLAAPGGDRPEDFTPAGDAVLSTSVDDRGGSREAVLQYKIGTSMAAPHVSGVLALMKVLHPALDAEAVFRLLADGQLTVDLGESGYDTFYGFGRIDALSAVEAAQRLQGGSSLPPEPPPFPVVNTESIDLGTAPARRLCVFNKGSGELEVLSSEAGKDWLTIEVVTGQVPGDYCLDMTVDRSGRRTGSYQTELTVTHQSGVPSLTLQISMTIDEAGPEGELGRVYMLLVEADGESGGDPAFFSPAEVQPLNLNEARFSMDEIRAGNFHVLTGSDVDNDGITCEVGESCGVYRTDGFPGVTGLDEDTEIATITFNIGDSGSVPELEIELSVIAEPVGHPLFPETGLPIPDLQD